MFPKIFTRNRDTSENNDKAGKGRRISFITVRVRPSVARSTDQCDISSVTEGSGTKILPVTGPTVPPLQLSSGGPEPALEDTDEKPKLKIRAPTERNLQIHDSSRSLSTGSTPRTPMFSSFRRRLQSSISSASEGWSSGRNSLRESGSSISEVFSFGRNCSIRESDTSISDAVTPSSLMSPRRRSSSSTTMSEDDTKRTPRESPFHGRTLFRGPNLTMMEGIVTIKLPFKNLQKFPMEILYCYNLEKLDLKGNVIKKLPQEIGGMTSLRAFRISRNYIQCLPESFADLVNLEDLDMNHNTLIRLPRYIGRLQKLVSLNVEHNQLKHLPPTFCEMANLAKLHAAENYLVALPDRIGYMMSNLRYIDVGKNQLPYIPYSVITIYGLNYLEAQHNKTGDYPVNYRGAMYSIRESLKNLRKFHELLSCRKIQLWWIKLRAPEIPDLKRSMIPVKTGLLTFYRKFHHFHTVLAAYRITACFDRVLCDFNLRDKLRKLAKQPTWVEKVYKSY